MAQADAGADPAAARIVAAAVDAETVAVVAGIAAPGAGNPGTFVTQQVGMVRKLMGSVKSFAEAELAVEECSGTGAEEECQGLLVEVCPQSAAPVHHLQNQTLAAAAVAVVCQK